MVFEIIFHWTEKTSFRKHKKSYYAMEVYPYRYTDIHTNIQKWFAQHIF